ncbi:unnamed protein product [Ectocarpus sp. 12 AP-2014]
MLLIKINMLLRVGSSWERTRREGGENVLGVGKKSGTGRGVLSWSTKRWNRPRLGRAHACLFNIGNSKFKSHFIRLSLPPACGRDVGFCCFDGKEQPPPWWNLSVELFARGVAPRMHTQVFNPGFTSTPDAVVASSADHCCVVC